MEITNTRVIKLDTNDLLQYLEDKGYVLAELNLQNIELKEKVLCFTFSDSAIDATALSLPNKKNFWVQGFHTQN